MTENFNISVPFSQTTWHSACSNSYDRKGHLIIWHEENKESKLTPVSSYVDYFKASRKNQF